MHIESVRVAIKQARKAGEEAHPTVMGLLQALEEIASEENSLALRDAISLLSRNPSSTIHSRDIAERLSKIRGIIESIQVPKEIVYAYPVTMHRHFEHYSKKWFSDNSIIPDVELSEGACVSDGFGCVWQRFTGPKELVEHLRENNIPIKVIE